MKRTRLLTFALAWFSLCLIMKDAEAKKKEVSYALRFLNNVLPPQLTHFTRPVYKLSEDAFVGFFQGFANIDLDTPLYCLTDGPATAIGFYHLLLSFLATRSSDVYSNLYDSFIPLWYLCNPFSAGGLININLLVSAPLISGAIQ